MLDSQEIITIKKNPFNSLYHKKSLSLIENSIDEYGLNVKTLSEKTFNNPTKKSRKWLTSIFQGQKDIGWVYIMKVLCKSKKIEQDLIFSELNESHLNLGKSSSKLTVNFVSLLLKYYNEKRVVKLLLTSDYDHNSDIIYMIKEIENKIDISFLPKKPKSLEEIHKCCERMIKKLKYDNYSLNQREDILLLDNEQINDNLIIKVPKTHYDLVDLGEDLSFCIGNGYYSKEVKEGNCSIVSIYKDTKAVYGIQFNRYSIKQAYGFDNELIPNEILVSIQNKLISRPELPNDFIAISDSKWINGYKYNDKDLYLLLNGKIYVYYDVEQYVYEELISSTRKGAYVNSIIKANYEYQKIS